MTTFPDRSDHRSDDETKYEQRLPPTGMGKRARFTAELPVSITRAASQQTFHTIRYLVDPERRRDAYRAYAYFRWVDDRLDQTLSDKLERVGFVERQIALVDGCYGGNWHQTITTEECIAVDLIRNDTDQNSGLHTYIRNMLAVMAFDANRQGRLISANELSEYSLHLATAVTEALHYFIGHGDRSLQSPERYLAVTAAHITHMLRDTCEDVAAGYFNVPSSLLETAGIAAGDLASAPYKAWVKSRVELARDYFRLGKSYLAQVESFRCRLAGYAYIARFEGLLSAMERDGYLIRSVYAEHKRLPAVIGMVGSVVINGLGFATQKQLTESF
jgi:phytoene/squalene synthetase